MVVTLRISKYREVQLDSVFQVVLERNNAKILVEPSARAEEPERSEALVDSSDNPEGPASTSPELVQPFQLSALIWLSTLYRASNVLSLEAVTAVLGRVLKLSSIPPSFDRPSLFLSDLLRDACANVETLRLPSPSSRLPPLPIISAAGYMDACLCSAAAQLGCIAMALTLETGRVSIDFLAKTATSRLPDVARVANDLQWLLNDSKVTPRTKLDQPDDGWWAESVTILATLVSAATAAMSVCRQELKSALRVGGSRPPWRPAPLEIVDAPRFGLIVAARRGTQNCIQRLVRHLLPAARKRAEQNASNETPSPGTCSSETALKSKLGEMLPEFERQLDVLERTSSIELGEASLNLEGHGLMLQLHKVSRQLASAFQLEVSLGRAILDDINFEIQRSSIEKIKKNKKNVATKLHIGKPLEDFLENMSSRIDTETASPFQLLNLQEKLTVALTPLNQGGRRPKVAKGAIDIDPHRMVIREHVFHHVRSVFKRYGAVSIDTPIFERKETLMGKYGEDQKLIFDLKDQGGEQLSLRYDLTVPFARYLATQNLDKIKRLHIGKVYRRDEPQVARGRFREFYQCDFDIAGDFDAVIADTEVLSALIDTLRGLQGALGKFVVKLNHRSLLDAIMKLCGVPASSFRPICSAIDKLDKLSWEQVKEEMCTTKGLASESADKIRDFVVLQGKPFELLAKLEGMSDLVEDVIARESLSHLRTVFECLEANGSLDSVVFDMSLARGLDYYTGVIFEAVLTGQDVVGSIAAGGRYDRLVGLFGPKHIPAVGVSIGVERVFRIIEMNLGLVELRDPNEARGGSSTTDAKSLDSPFKSGHVLFADHEIDVFVCSIGDGTLMRRIGIVKMLRDQNIGADFMYARNPKLNKQLAHASSLRVPVVVIFGSDEMQKNTVKLRRLYYDWDTSGNVEKEVEVPLTTVVAEIKNILNDMHCLRDRTRRAIISDPIEPVV